MKIAIISQTFYPDTVAVAQILADLAVELDERGHEVTVLASRYAYDDKSISYPLFENWQKSIKIIRVKDTALGKSSLLKRFIDFFSYSFWTFIYLLRLKPKEFDVIIGMTSPPLIAFLVAFFKKFKGYTFFYWTMDLQPELLIASNMLSERSALAKILTRIADYTLQKADCIGALDGFMKNYIKTRKIEEEKIKICPIWSILEDFYAGTREENPFRIQQNWKDKIIVMYSGNHSVVHPLDTLLEVAKELEGDKRFLFVFIGNGVRTVDVSDFKKKHSLENIMQLPYQPRNKVHISLGSSDIQVVVMGDCQVGFTHPCKIHGALFSEKPVLYVGPSPSHITEILTSITGNGVFKHGQKEEIIYYLLKFAEDFSQRKTGENNRKYALKNLSPEILKNQVVQVIETLKF